MKITIHNEEEIDKLVNAYLKMSEGIKLAFLYGDLGAGKTTFVKRLVSRLESTDHASSPTYSLVNEYLIGTEKLYHIDLYRLHDTAEALDMGIEEYIYSGNHCLVEWPQIIESLADEYIKIEIVALADQSRDVQIEHIKP